MCCRAGAGMAVRLACVLAGRAHGWGAEELQALREMGCVCVLSASGAVGHILCLEATSRFPPTHLTPTHPPRVFPPHSPPSTHPPTLPQPPNSSNPATCLTLLQSGV